MQPEQFSGWTAAEIGKDGLQARVGEMCDELDLFHFHVPDSRRATRKGFPDCWIINMRTGRAMFRELKSQSGTLSRSQKALGYALVAGGHDWAVWRPADLLDGSIGAELAALARHRLRVTG